MRLWSLGLLAASSFCSVARAAESGVEPTAESGDPSPDTDAEPNSDSVTTEALYETVVTARREDPPPLDATVPVTIISKRELEERPPLTVAEAATAVPGVSLNAPAGLLYTNPSIRGLGGRRVVMLRNGRRIDSGKPIGVSGYFLGPFNTESIEVIRGPGAVMYGSDAVGGVINAVAPSPLAKKGVTGGYGLTVGSNNNALSNAFFADFGAERFGLRMHGMLRRADNYRTGSGEPVENSFYEDKAVGGSFAVKPATGHVLEVYTDAYFGGESGRAVNALDEEKRRRITFPKDDNLLVDAAYHRHFSGGTVEQLGVDVYFDRTARHLRRDLYSSGYTRVTSTMDQKSELYTLGLHPDANLVPFADNSLVLGLDVRMKTLSMEQTVTTFLPGGIHPPPARSRPYDGAHRLDLGIFASDEQKLGRYVTLAAGLRGDVVRQWYPEEGVAKESEDGAFSGNLGLNVHPVQWTAFTMNIGRAFRSPTLDEKFVELAFCKGTVCGRPDVVPEKSLNLDAGITAFHRFLSVEAYFFAIFIDDFITLADAADGHCDYEYINVPRARLIGGEARLSVHKKRLIGPVGMRLSTAVAYTRGDDLKTRSALAQIPPLNQVTSLRFFLGRYRYVDKPFVETELVFNAPQHRISAAGNVASQAETETERYLTADLTVGVGLLHMPDKLSLDIILQVRNLADTLYRDHLSTVPAMGRNVVLNGVLRY